MQYLVWDYDGTLGYRSGGWSGAMVDALHARGINHVTPEQIRPHILTGFRWHDHEREHASGVSADDWWGELHGLFSSAFVAACGVGQSVALELARDVRRQYLRPDTWHLYDDTCDALSRLSDRGYAHVLLTNHVPELPRMLEVMGIAAQFVRIFNSAATGVEKPHPRAYANVIAFTGPEAVMIGDNPRADFAGARAAGLEAILVRRQTPGIEPFCADLAGVLHMLK